MNLTKDLAFTRRDFVQLAIGGFVLAGIPLLNRQRRPLITHSLPAMGTIAELGAVHHDRKFALRALQAAGAELKRIEALMTRFVHSSDIGRVNALAGLERAQVAAETVHVVQRALDWAAATEGAFDPALARVADLWDVKHRRTPPPAASVQRLANRNLYRRIDIDADGPRPSLLITEPDALIDLGGIAAGHGVDRAVHVLREHGIEHGYVNIGGDIYVLGESPKGEPWRIGIRSPSDPDQIIGQLSLSDAAVATSGDYEQVFQYQGRRYHHIMDPQTAAPRLTDEHSLTITADHCIDADAATTALYGWPHSKAQHVLAQRAPHAKIVSHV